MPIHTELTDFHLTIDLFVPVQEFFEKARKLVGLEATLTGILGLV